MTLSSFFKLSTFIHVIHLHDHHYNQQILGMARRLEVMMPLLETILDQGNTISMHDGCSIEGIIGIAIETNIDLRNTV